MNEKIFILMIILIIAGCVNMEESKGNRYGVIETGKGLIKFELFEGRAKVTTKNFIDLAEGGFYDNLIFHRVVPGFVVQGGDPTGTGTGGSGKTIPLEIHPDLKHCKGAVGMARSSDPNSATSQFYITLEETPNLDGDYAVFGRVVEGVDVVGKIEKGDRMIRVYITDI